MKKNIDGGLGPAPKTAFYKKIQRQRSLGNQDKMTAMLTQKGGQELFGQFITNYARAQLDKDISIQNQVTEQVLKSLPQSRAPGSKR